ncbi:hypothetical protein SLA2020_254970 [Shorea laevis]
MSGFRHRVYKNYDLRAEVIKKLAEEVFSIVGRDPLIEVRDKQIARIIGKAPTISVAAYLRMAGRPPVLPFSNLSYAENFLYMLDSIGNRSYKPNPQLARVLDILFILHAEHEMNSSTASASLSARHLVSGGVDVYAALAGAVGALYGPLHGGANDAALKMIS